MCRVFRVFQWNLLRATIQNIFMHTINDVKRQYVSLYCRIGWSATTHFLWMRERESEWKRDDKNDLHSIDNKYIVGDCKTDVFGHSGKKENAEINERENATWHTSNPNKIKREKKEEIKRHIWKFWHRCAYDTTTILKSLNIPLFKFHFHTYRVESCSSNVVRVIHGFFFLLLLPLRICYISETIC